MKMTIEKFRTIHRNYTVIEGHHLLIEKQEVGCDIESLGEVIIESFFHDDEIKTHLEYWVFEECKGFGDLETGRYHFEILLDTSDFEEFYVIESNFHKIEEETQAEMEAHNELPF